ncbi:PAS domain-containing protein [Ferrovibrio sp.]|uniref:PAS domain-containing protein n=1 Tax=Ferrovibrio sp. TaxID=1917215 RepID=UPI00262A2836|nr:PAS domain-containing protein [Ferrovibrio sp.]
MTANPPSLVDDAKLSYVLSCWQRWREGHAWPAREDIDPLDLKRLLPNLFLLESIDGGRRFRFILAGQTVRENLGFELSQRFLDDLFSGEQLARAEAYYRLVITGHGHYAVQHWLQRDRPVMEFRRLLLPLAADRGHINGIFGFALYDRLDGSLGKPVDHLNDPVSITTLSAQTIEL